MQSDVIAFTMPSAAPNIKQQSQATNVQITGSQLEPASPLENDFLREWNLNNLLRNPVTARKIRKKQNFRASPHVHQEKRTKWPTGQIDSTDMKKDPTIKLN